MPPKWLFIQSRGTMVFTFILGIVLAVGHHLYYNHLAGQVPPDTSYGIANVASLTGQQINLATGAVFVFLVKSFLSRAIFTAHEQTVWRAITNPSRPTKVVTIDGLLSSTTNVFSLAQPGLWARSFISMCLAIFSWLLTVAFFFPASTLTVQSSANPSSSMLRVPQIDFLSMNFANVVKEVSLSPQYGYDGPWFGVQAAVAAAMTGSEILGITAPHPNSSWSLEFIGPTLFCGNVDADLHTKITDNIIAVLNSTVCSTSYGYLAWTSSTTTEDPLPFIGAKYAHNSPAVGLGPLPIEQSPPFRPLSLYVAALPNMLHSSFNGGETCETSAHHQVAEATIVECILGNASYAANFTFVDTVQRVQVERQQVYNNVSYLNGVAGVSFLNATYTNGTVVPGEFNTTKVANWAYQAVMNTFNSMVLGDISLQHWGGQVVNTSMAMTSLINTKELSFLFNLNDSQSPLPTTLVSLPSSQWNGLSTSQDTNFTASMVDMLETMFINSTISLMHSSFLNPNYSSPYAPGLVNVTITPYQNVYTYSRTILWASYGAAIAFTLLSICSGIFAAFADKASYTTKFSTILRMSQTVQLSAPLLLEDAGGEDPTPETVNQTEVRFPRSSHRYEALAPDSNLDVRSHVDEVLERKKGGAPS